MAVLQLKRLSEGLACGERILIAQLGLGQQHVGFCHVGTQPNQTLERDECVAHVSLLQKGSATNLQQLDIIRVCGSRHVAYIQRFIGILLFEIGRCDNTRWRGHLGEFLCGLFDRRPRRGEIVCINLETINRHQRL